MLSAVLDELHTIVAGVLLGHGTLSPFHWRSLLWEFEHTRQAFGPAVATALLPILSALERSLDPSGPPTKASAGELRDRLTEARQGLREPPLRKAAWDDVLAAFERNLDPEQSGARIRVLRDLIEVADDDWAGVSSALAGALNDDAYALMRMGHEVAERPNRLTDPAGWTLDKRLDACREFVQAPAPRARLVAWIAFDHAFLPQLYQRLGPVELWAGQVYPDWLAGGNGREDGPVPELASEQHTMFLPDASGEPWVLMRLDLGERPSAGAVDHARDLALMIVQMAVTNSDWELMPGCALVRDLNWWGSTIHRLPPGAQRDDPRYEPTGHYLAQLNPEIVQGLTARLPEVEDAAADVRWAESVRGVADGAQRAALAVRLLERRLPEAVGRQAGWGKKGSWAARSRWWLREDWANLQLFNDLRDAAFEGVYGIERALNQELFLHYETLMLPRTEGLGFEYRPKAIMRGLRELQGHLRTDRMANRIVGWTATQLADGRAAAGRIDEHRAGFDVLLRRANRVRNAVLHGNDTVPAVVASVEPFLQRLAQAIIGAQLRGLETPDGIRTELNNLRDRHIAELDRLRNGEDPADVLFPDTEAH
ncbi:MAG TPA: hypothetical protein VID48_13780 [Solirubrobacteraceae bacterium]|jgi:hypothetical protein